MIIARDDFPLGVGLGRFGSAISRDPYSPVYTQYGLDQIEGMTPKQRLRRRHVLGAHPGRDGRHRPRGTARLPWRCSGAVARNRRLLLDEPLAVAFLLGAWMVFIQALVETLASSMFDSPPRMYLLFGAVGVALSLARSARKPE